MAVQCVFLLCCSQLSDGHGSLPVLPYRSRPKKNNCRNHCWNHRRNRRILPREIRFLMRILSLSKISRPQYGSGFGMTESGFRKLKYETEGAGRKFPCRNGRGIPLKVLRATRRFIMMSMVSRPVRKQTSMSRFWICMLRGFPKATGFGTVTIRIRMADRTGAWSYLMTRIYLL